MSPSPASIRFLLYAGGNHCNLFSSYLIKIAVVMPACQVNPSLGLNFCIHIKNRLLK